jgi:hypothetical protein
MKLLSMPDCNFPVCALPCLAYTASITLNHQELA